MKELVSKLDHETITNSLANKGNKWHFDLLDALNFVGIHESMIKSAKKAIFTILGNADITDEELLTAITGAEGLINSRSLTYQSAH